MAFLVNDLSLHGQFHEVAGFRAAIDGMMQIRAAVERLGHALYCHRALAHAELGPSLNMQQAVGALPLAKQRAVLLWMRRVGPFWEDERSHGEDVWLEHADAIVTDTALGEAAWRALGHGEPRQLVSFTPSNFMSTPLTVARRDESNAVVSTISVDNHWTVESAVAAAEAAAVAPDSWAALEMQARARFDRLSMAADAFEPLAPHPFHPSAAERVMVILDVLHRLRGSIDAAGERTAEGHELYQNYFTGDKAVFSDSSDTEKRKYERALTFRDPSGGPKALFCPWHGKVKSPQYRVHFSYPVGADEPLYVVYVGPKLTT